MADLNNNKHLLNCDKIRIEAYQGHWFRVFRIVPATDLIHDIQLVRANGRNIVGHAATPNIVECHTLRPYAHPVACYCVLFGVVAQSLKPIKLLGTTSNIVDSVASACTYVT